MKKFIAIALVLITLTLCFTSCGKQDSIEIGPHELNMPDTYEIVYTIVQDEENGAVNEIVKETVGCDPNGNFIRYGGEYNKLYIAKGEDSYDEYYSEGTGTYELKQEGKRWADAAYDSLGNLEYTYKDVRDDATYEKIESLTLPDDLKAKDLIFLDAERFDYYIVTGGSFRDGQSYQAAVEKETGACFYAYYEPTTNSYGYQYGEYYFYVSEYTTPYDGDYATKLS